MTTKTHPPSPAQAADPFAEFDALFNDIVVPSAITKPTSTKKKDNSIAAMRKEKLDKIVEWIKAHENGEPRKSGKGARGNLSSPTVDPNYVSLKLSHGPAGNVKLYFKGVWKTDHIIPANIEIQFWKATIKLFEDGRYDAELEDLKKRVHAAFWNEDGTRKAPNPKKVKGNPAADIKHDPKTAG